MHMVLYFVAVCNNYTYCMNVKPEIIFKKYICLTFVFVARSVRITKRKLNSGASGASAAKRSKATKSQASIIDPEVTGYECDLDDEG